MKILVVGSGGREHALAWKMAQSDRADTVYVAPGNAGTEKEDKLNNIAISAEDIHALKTFAGKEKIDLAIIGPETPLVAGIVDVFQKSGLSCFGPTKRAAILEGSKSFTKDFLKKYTIPTAEYAVFTDVNPAVEYVKSKTAPIVIKADGLAAGKGVIIASTREEAIKTIREMLEGNKFGAAGHRIVIEEFLEGEEVSFTVMTDGKHVLPLASSQDHKARDEGGKGPNTGGMGAYSPAPIVNEAMHHRIMDEIIMPTIKGMADENRIYTGILYAGIMITADGAPKVLEFNCRFGDPETQAIMMRLTSDLVELCLSTISGSLEQYNLKWDERTALAVVAASAGYPNSTKKGDVINGLNSGFPDAVKVFHAGTANNANHIVTAGGRVLCVTGLGETIIQAQQQAYQAIKKIKYDGMFYRKDIGYREVGRSQ